MQHDVALRAAARVIYDSCYPSDEWSPVRFEDAERLATIHYRQAVDAAQRARGLLTDRTEQLCLSLPQAERGARRTGKAHR
jgi:hypothetical protein